MRAVLIQPARGIAEGASLGSAAGLRRGRTDVVVAISAGLIAAYVVFGIVGYLLVAFAYLGMFRKAAQPRRESRYLVATRLTYRSANRSRFT
jgi:hypothetical protein